MMEVTVESVTNELSVVYTNAYTSDDVHTDVNAALAVWNLADDIQYPWRLDAEVTHGPLVTYNERGPIKPDFSIYPGTDPTPPPRSDIADGGIIGAPLDRQISAGNPNGVWYNPGYFNFAHLNYKYCIEDAEKKWYVESFGAYAPSYLPFATQWVNDLDAGVLPQGAFPKLTTLGITRTRTATGTTLDSPMTFSWRRSTQRFCSPSRRITSRVPEAATGTCMTRHPSAVLRADRDSEL